MTVFMVDMELGSSGLQMTKPLSVVFKSRHVCYPAIKKTIRRFSSTYLFSTSMWLWWHVDFFKQLSVNSSSLNHYPLPFLRIKYAVFQKNTSTFFPCYYLFRFGRTLECPRLEIQRDGSFWMDFAITLHISRKPVP